MLTINPMEPLFCIPEGSPRATMTAVVLDFYAGPSLVYSAGAWDGVKAELTAPENINPDEVLIRDRLAEQPCYDELDGLSLVSAFPRRG
jgi:hypothetical protein